MSLILVLWSWRSEHTLSLHTGRGKSGPAFTIPCTTTRSVNHIGDSLWCLLILSSSLDACSSETLLQSPGLQETYLWECWEGWIWILIYTKFIKIHGKADSPMSIHPLSLLTDAQGRKPGHQFKSAIFSWQEPASLLYHDMAWPCCNVSHAVSIRSIPPSDYRGQNSHLKCFEKKILLNDIWKTQEIIRHTKYYLNLCFKPFTNNQ